MSKAVELHVLARRANVDAMDLVRHFPTNFAVPRDWWMQQSRVLIASESLNALALALDGAGLMAAGNAVREVREELLPRKNWAREAEARLP